MFEPEPINNKLISQIESLATIFRNHLRKVCEEEGLSPIQANVLVAARAGDESVSSLAARFMVTKATMSDSIKSLIAKGLLVERDDENDRRRKQLRLTAAGKRKAEAVPRWAERVEQALAELHMSEKGVLVDNLQILLSHLANSPLYIADENK